MDTPIADPHAVQAFGLQPLFDSLLERLEGCSPSLKICFLEAVSERCSEILMSLDPNFATNFPDFGHLIFQERHMLVRSLRDTRFFASALAPLLEFVHLEPNAQVRLIHLIGLSSDCFELVARTVKTEAESAIACGSAVLFDKLKLMREIRELDAIRNIPVQRP